MFATFARMANPSSDFDLARAKRVGALIRRYREAADLTQEELMKRLGMNSDNRAWIREIERGQRYRNELAPILKPEQYAQIAVILGVDASELLTAARIDPKEWPEMSGIEGAYAPTIDAGGLTERQIRVIEELTATLRDANTKAAGE